MALPSNEHCPCTYGAECRAGVGRPTPGSPGPVRGYENEVSDPVSGVGSRDRRPSLVVLVAVRFDPAVLALVPPRQMPLLVFLDRGLGRLECRPRVQGRPVDA